MANPDLGTKQVCPNCQSKFYDLNRRPAHCPKCGADFDPEEAVRSRRARTRTAAPDYEAEEEAPKPAETEEGFEEQDDTPEIDEAAKAEAPEGEAAAKPEADHGVGYDEDEGAEIDAEGEDVPFLEEEEEEAFSDEPVERHGGEEDR